MRGLVALLCLLATAAHGAEIERAQISFKGRTYRYAFTALIAAPRPAVRAIVTDYDRLGRINDDITESRVLEHDGDGRLKRVLRMRQCVLFFCFKLVFVETVEQTPDRIRTVVIPAESTFRDGVAEWRIDAVDPAHTRISVEATQTPTFWIPPVIGPFLLKRIFLKEVRETSENIERLARAGGG